MRKTITVTEITSDLSGDTATERREFVWQGTGYALDLTKREASEIDGFLAPYIAVAQVQKKRAAAGQGKRVRTPRNSETAAIREWAVARGITINAQGRIPTLVREQYDAEQKVAAKTTKTTKVVKKGKTLASASA